MTKILGILLIVAGTLGLIYGGFTYTKDSHTANLGPVVVQVKDRETIFIPIIASVMSIGLGALLLLGFRRT